MSTQEKTMSFPFSVLTDFAVAQAIFGAYQAGIWEPFQRDLEGSLEPEAFAAERGLNGALVRGVLEYLTRRGYFETLDTAGRRSFKLASQGRELIANHWLGHFVFLVGGYGEVLGHTGDLLTRKMSYGKDLVRNGHYVAEGSELQGKHPRHRSFSAMLDRVAALPRPGVLLDIGCGSAGFLIQLMRRTEAARGVGIDANHESCELAKRNVTREGFGDRIDIFEGDACAPAALRPSLTGTVDVVTAMFILHEFFSRGVPQTVQILRDISRVLSPGKGFLMIMDKHTDVFDGGGAPPYFTEFKLVHDLTNQILCSRAQWHSMLEAANLRVVAEEILDRHTGTILFQCAVA